MIPGSVARSTGARGRARDEAGDLTPMRIGLFVTCFDDLLHPEVGRAVVRILRRLGPEVAYPETAARYEYMDLLAGKRAEGLSLDEMREVVAAFDVRTTVA